jgi:hypothetical protein
MKISTSNNHLLKIIASFTRAKLTISATAVATPHQTVIGDAKMKDR